MHKGFISKTRRIPRVLTIQDGEAERRCRCDQRMQTIAFQGNLIALRDQKTGSPSRTGRSEDFCGLGNVSPSKSADAFPSSPEADVSPKLTAQTTSGAINAGIVRDLDERRVRTLARLVPMLSIMAGEGPEIVGYDPARLYNECLMALGIEDADNPDITAEIAAEHTEGFGVLAKAEAGHNALVEEIVAWLRLRVLRAANTYERQYHPEDRGYLRATEAILVAIERGDYRSTLTAKDA